MRSYSWLVLGFGAAVVAACGGSVAIGDLGSTPTDGGTADGGSDSAAIECTTKEACGPAPKSPAIMCSDGSLGGNTGRCLATATGCSWEQRECPPDACFDPKGALNPSFKTCTTKADCVAVTYQLDCCGSMQATGVNSASETAVQKCALDRAAGFPGCGCAARPTIADDGTTDPGGGTPSVTCSSAGQCTTSFEAGATCGATTCKPGGTCCSGVPFPEPTCIDTGACPVSQRKFKKDITYLSLADRERLNDELQRFPLATYRYTSESEATRTHLGFIIDDVAPSPAVLQSGERVDLYGYQTMTVAALQVQARELAALRQELDELKADCRKRR